MDSLKICFSWKLVLSQNLVILKNNLKKKIINIFKNKILLKKLKYKDCFYL